MAHANQFEFISLVKQQFPGNFSGGKVLEVGSLDINGSVRSFFAADRYIGVDVAEGPGVDEVCQGQLLDHPTGTFDAVISCECMEHNPFWVETLANMFRMAKPGALVIVSFATTGRAEHGTTRTAISDSPLSISIGWEYYRNISAAMFKQRLNLDYWFDDYLMVPNWHNCDLYFVGIKKPSAKGKELGPLRQALASRFRPSHSLRSTCVWLAARTSGEVGVGAMRAIWRLLPRAK
ncbi:MAG: class I SAM-dependent methyltransferase [Acidovorax sp.]|nr:class I SAM-dependent methyltransferase [Acidovorax sp.]